MNHQQVLEFATAFSDAVVEYSTTVRGHYDLVDSLEKSAYGVCMNTRKAGMVETDDDILDRYHSAMRDCYETEYWLEMIADLLIASETTAKKLLADCLELRRMLFALTNEQLFKMGRQKRPSAD